METDKKYHAVADGKYVLFLCDGVNFKLGDTGQVFWSYYYYGWLCVINTRDGSICSPTLKQVIPLLGKPK